MDSAEVNRHRIPLISGENKSSETKLTENIYQKYNKIWEKIK